MIQVIGRLTDVDRDMKWLGVPYGSTYLTMSKGGD